MKTGAVSLHILVHRSGKVIVGIDKPDVIFAADQRQEGGEYHSLRLAVPDRPFFCHYFVVPGGPMSEPSNIWNSLPAEL
jgi:hypothetical protein